MVTSQIRDDQRHNPPFQQTVAARHLYLQQVKYDLFLYKNFSVVMNREETERYINVVVSTNHWKKQRGAQIMFMYPALYR